MINKVFKTTVTGVGPWCVEFPDGEILAMRTESRANLVANASVVTDLLAEVGSLLNTIRAQDGVPYHDQKYNGGYRIPYCTEESFYDLVERIHSVTRE